MLGHETLRTHFAVVEGELVQTIATASTLIISLPLIDLRQLSKIERAQLFSAVNYPKVSTAF